MLVWYEFCRTAFCHFQGIKLPDTMNNKVSGNCAFLIIILWEIQTRRRNIPALFVFYFTITLFT